MENKNFKRGRGRPRVLTDEERKQHNTNYMSNKPWYCDICNNGKNYTLAGKTCHQQTVKHLINLSVEDILNNIDKINDFGKFSEICMKLIRKCDRMPDINKV